MARLRNIGTKVQSLTLPPAREVTLQPGEEISGAPVYMALKLQEGNDFAVEWEPGEIKHKDAAGNITHLTYRSPWNPFDGYGWVGLVTLLALERAGVHVSVQQPELFQGRFAFTLDALERHYPDALRLIKRPDKYPTQWGLVHAIPPDLQWMKTPKKVLHTMWEATRLPTDFQGMDWDYWMKQADAIIVPSSGQVPIFQDSGYTGPIHVVSDCIEVDSFPFVERPLDRKPFTFFTWGRLSARKDPISLISAFSHSFGPNDDVRLVVKTRDNLCGMTPIPTFRDSRVTVINDNWPKARLLEEIANADCAVFMSHGEGFYCPPIQAALTGLYTIGPDHSGCKDWANPKYFGVCGLDQQRPYEDSPLGLRDGKPTQWWVQDKDQVIEQMRWAYHNREAAAKKGKAASMWCRKRFSPDAVIPQLLKVLSSLD